MSTAAVGKRGRDLAGGIVRPLLVFGLPTLAVLGTGYGGFSERVLAVVWPLAFLWLGAACLSNARRCGRVHCWFTGPFFLLMSVLSLLHGTQVLSLGPDGWRLLGNGFAIGGTILYSLPERIWGRYFRSGSAETQVSR